LAQKVNPFFKRNKNMFGNYYYPYYRSFSPYAYPTWGYPGYPGYGGYSSNIVGSAIANQNMVTVGAGAIGGIQTATPTVVW
jgi:hypothetical protein